MPTLDRRAAARRVLDRFSFGPRPGELTAAAARGAATTLDLLLGSTADPGTRATPPPDIGPQPATPTKGDKAARAARSAAVREQQAVLLTWWLDRMVAAGGSAERLTWFWHGHFATSVQKVRDPRLMLIQNETLRRSGSGSFTTLAHAMVVDPALLVWLDAQKNTVGTANENLGREFMELFTLGVDHYTEDDVRAGSRALTGWTVDRTNGTARFRAARHDTGILTLLGRTGPLDAAGYVELVLSQPSSAPFVAGRVWRRLVSDTPPPPDAQARLVSAYGDGRSISALLHAIVAEPAFLDRTSTIVKQPVEWAVGLMRAVGVQPATLSHADQRIVLASLTGMGQIPFAPPSVGGWPAGAAWLTTSAGVARLALAKAVAAHADLSVLQQGSADSRVEAVRDLLGVDAFTARTRSALTGVASSPIQLLQAAASSPEYVVSA
ncbi:MAG: DUF1800 domain-containing protein [Mycobacteriaceae bacterium]